MGNNSGIQQCCYLGSFLFFSYSHPASAGRARCEDGRLCCHSQCVLTGFRTMSNAHIAALLREVTTLVAGEQKGQRLCQPEKGCDWGKYIPGWGHTYAERIMKRAQAVHTPLSALRLHEYEKETEKVWWKVKSRVYFKCPSTT